MKMEGIKKITVIGAGESGNGAALLALRKGFNVKVSDYGAIQEKYKQELDRNGIEYEENGHDVQEILSSDLVIKSPGVPNHISLIKQIREKKIKLISEIEWAYHFRGQSKIVAITGSNGKSTTTKMICHMLRRGGVDAAMVGNIGISMARQIAEDPKEVYVTEISSFQLDDIIEFKPDIAIILNITPDHLDRYNNNIEEYAEAKFRITENQDENDILIINQDDQLTQKLLKDKLTKARIIPITMNTENNNLQDGAFMNNDEISMQFQDQYMGLPIKDISVKGKHNLYNSMAAGISAMAVGIRNSALRESFSTFEGLEHRLEYVATVKGVDYINDSKATNLNSVWYALESMTQPVVLILGGKDKGNDYNEIMEIVKEKVVAIICMGVDNAPIHAAFDGIVDLIVDTSGADEAVQAAYEIAAKGNVVLLSPGCASFDLFTNYEDRGTQFKQAVKKL